MSRRIAFFVFGALLLASCRVGVDISVQLRDDGSGTVTVTAVADADVVTAAPGLADDLRFDDLIGAGWTVDGPTATKDGGLSVVLVHPFATPAEAAAIVASLSGPGGPFRSIAFERLVADGGVTTSVTGTLRVDAGLAAFGDAQLQALVPTVPYADAIAAAGGPTQALEIVFGVELPGKVERTTAADPGEVSWRVPLDGSSVDLATSAVSRPSGAGGWKLSAAVLRFLLVAWVVFSVAFVLYVAAARRRRAVPLAHLARLSRLSGLDRRPGAEAPPDPTENPRAPAP